MYLEREVKEAYRTAHTYGLAVDTNEMIDARYLGGEEITINYGNAFVQPQVI
ncbi:hypothetical protein PR002_g28782 [Phytophthora rubi]|uniref:Uncharacterized protein n=1 Tax=Phytophthora rubi TaxID=129364 RepID=A0A6A3H5Y2_9STRA|nr:hypothetical protein PR002_g28782 [Phytophthora rubi]